MIFKKRLVMLAIGAFLSLNAMAQETTFGVKGGLNVANVGGDSQGVESKLSFHAGLYASLLVSENFAIQPELVYSAQGAAIENADENLNYNYVNVPVMFKFYPTESFYLQAGPQLGILLSAEVADFDVKDQLNDIDFAFGIGAGYETQSLNFSLRYNAGISSTAEDSGDDSFPNQVLQLTVGFPFN